MPEVVNLSPGEGSSAIPCESDSCAALGHRQRFGLKFLFLVVTVAAIWAAISRVQNLWSMGVVSVILLTWLFGCPRTRRATVVVTAAMLAPFAWLLLIDYPWNEYRWQWFRMWASLPGLLPMRMFSNSETVYLPGGMVLTVFGFLAVVTTIRFVPTAWYWMPALVVLACSLMAWGCLMGFLM